MYIVCKQLGYTGLCESGDKYCGRNSAVLYLIYNLSLSPPHFIANVAYPGSFFGPGTGPAIYTNVQCGGHEGSFADCTKDSYSSVMCTVDNIAGAQCSTRKN